MHAFEQIEKIMEKESVLRYQEKQKVAPKKKNALRVMSYNIRMAPFKEDDSNKNAWRYRLPKVTMLLKRYTPDIVGLQEISALQEADLKKTCSTFEYICRAPKKNQLNLALELHITHKQ